VTFPRRDGSDIASLLFMTMLRRALSMMSNEESYDDEKSFELLHDGGNEGTNKDKILT
jgi:hypothetical protein